MSNRLVAELHDELGRFVAGSHWRPHQAFREKAWLQHEYVDLQRSAEAIALEFGVTNVAILFWLRRHNIPRRRSGGTYGRPEWGSPGMQNGMFGRTGKRNPAWKGGRTPERQSFYNTAEWKTVAAIVLKRERNCCQRCHKSLRRNSLHIHHIVSFAIRELRAKPSNLAILCDTCHQWVHSRQNRKGAYLAPLFTLNLPLDEPHVLCAFCNKTPKAHGRRTCSKSCGVRLALAEGRMQPRPKKPRPACQHCGNSVKTPNGKTCSRACSNRLAYKEGRWHLPQHHLQDSNNE